MAKKSKSLLIPSEDKLDKYRAHLIEHKPLSDQDTKMLERYRKAFSLLCKAYSRSKVVRWLEKEYDISQPQAYAIVRESTELYGLVIDTDKRGRKQIMYENFMRIAELAEKDGDHQAALRALENAAKVSGDFEDDISTMDADLFLIPKDIIFTTDPTVFIAQQKKSNPDIHDIDYEETE